MIGRDSCLSILNAALSHSDADQTEARLVGEDLALTRFANSRIHQNVRRKTCRLMVRTVVGKKVGVASTDEMDAESVAQVVQRATDLARAGQENEDFVSLPEAIPVSETDNHFDCTASYTAGDRADDVARVVRAAADQNFSAFGAHTIVEEEVAVMNSLGVEVHDVSTHAYLRTVLEGEAGTGYADSLARDVCDIDAREVGAEAVERTALAQNPRALEPGEYEAVFHPYAVADIVRFLGYLGFPADAVQEDRSFMSDRLCEQVTGENISIHDDGLHEATLNMPFDYEGVPKERVDLIDRGKAVSPVYDSYSAHREGRKSTGHAHYRRGSLHCMPANMVMTGGNCTVEDMISEMERGLLVTRFHYTHCPDPKKVLMTGTTRDGTMWVEDGKIRHPVRNMRLTDSVLRMFENTVRLSSHRKLQRDWWSTFTSLLPAVHVQSSRWTGGTEF